MFKLSTLFSFTVILCLSFLSVSAQEKTVLHINVFDQTSARVSGAMVNLSNQTGEFTKSIIIPESKEMSIVLSETGRFFVEVKAAGFRTYNQQVDIKQGENELNINLEIEELKIDVDVTPEIIERRFEEAFTRNFNQDEIDALSNNPSDVESELKRKYGDDVVIRVNGFTGGQLPPKDQIASVKIIKSSFDAEFHIIGNTVADIKTRAGSPKLSGLLAFNFNDSAFNARDFFAPEKLPQQNKYFVGYLAGPVIKDKTSFSFLLFAVKNLETKNIVAIVPEETFDRKVNSEIKTLTSTIGLDHNFGKSHGLHINFSFGKAEFLNMGAGDLKLAEAAFSRSDSINQVQIFESGLINKKYVNEFRLQWTFENSQLIPNTRVPSIVVLNTFIAGGAEIDNTIRQQKIDAADNLLFDKGKHSIKVGGEIKIERYRIFSADNTNGKFTFTSLADYLNNRPAVFTQRQGTSRTSLQQSQISVYIQDDIRLYRNFQIGLGLRYERQNNLRDFNNFSPRVSFIYSPEKTGKIVFRAGAGVFYNWFSSQNLTTILNNDGRQVSDLIIINPGYPNPLSGSITSQTLAPSVLRKDDNLKNPYFFVTQAGFNFRATKNLNIETFYAFRRGFHQFRSRDINAPIDGLRSNPLFGRITQVESSGNIVENSIELKLDGTLPKNISFNTRYRLAKSINDFDGIFDLPADNYNTNLERGVSSLDRRHFLTGNFNVILPGKLQVTPIYRFASPLPYSITTGRDDNGDTIFNDRPFNIKRNSERGTWLKQFDLRLSWRIPFAEKENQAENQNKVVNHTTNSSDFLKNYSIGIDITAQNIFNQINLQNYVGNQLSPFYRQPTSSTPARRIQLGLNFIF